VTSRQFLLIIDDNPANLLVVVRHFEDYAFEIITALDGAAGLERARSERPALILLDVEMPGIDGFETCRRLKADPDCAEIPVIFMTARTRPEDKFQGFAVGGVDYVTKPIEVRELTARVQAHLQIRALQAERERLLEIVRAQSEDLRRLTHELIERGEGRDRELSRVLQEEVSRRVSQAREHLLSEAGGAPDVEEMLALLEPALGGVAALQGGWRSGRRRRTASC